MVLKPVFESGQDLEANGDMKHKVPNPGNEEKEIYNGSKKTNEMDYTFPWLVKFAGIFMLNSFIFVNISFPFVKFLLFISFFFRLITFLHSLDRIGLHVLGRF